HCSKSGHTHDKCWTLHANLKPVRNTSARSNNNSDQNRNNSYRSNSNNNRGAQSNNNNQNNNGRKCYSCGVYGHFANACPNRQYNPNIPQQQYVNIPPQYSNVPSQNRPQNAAVFNTNRECNIYHAQGQSFHVWQQCPMVRHLQQQNMTNTTSATTDLNIAPYTDLNGNIDERLFVDCKVDNHIYKSLIDSGAEICLISIDNVNKNHNANLITKAEINVTGIGGSAKVHDELANELLLGADFIRKNKFIIDISNNKLLKNSNNIEVKTSFQVNATNNVIKPKAVLINKNNLSQT
ncbi:unnamed protein product, partial [Rotaria socialis]